MIQLLNVLDYYCLLDSAIDGKSRYNTVSIIPIHDLAAARIEDARNIEIYEELDQEASEYFEDEY